MKTILRFAGGLLLCSALFTPATHAYYNVAGNGTLPATANGTTFTVAPTEMEFHKPTGDLYACLGTAGAGNSAVSYVNNRSNVNSAPTFTAIGTAATITNLAIARLAICPYASDVTLPTVVVSPTVAATLNAFTKSNQTTAATAALLDIAGAQTGGVQGLTGGTDTVFAGILAAAGGNFGATSSGISGALLSRTSGAAGITLYNMNTGAAGNVPFDAGFVYTANTANPLFNSGTGTTVSPNIDMWYDETIGNTVGNEKGRLFVAVQNATAAVGDTSAWCIGTLIVNKTATSLTLTGTKLLSTLMTADTTTYMMSIRTSGAARQVGATKVRTMSTSTGLKYLIFAGGSSNSTIAGAGTNGNTVFAIPLVNNSGVANTDGLPAKVTSFTGGQYTVPVGAAADFMISTSAAARVGGVLGNVLPFIYQAGASISDLYVDGDAVYASFAVASSPALATLSDPGVYSSQAVFNDLGQIDHWTDWRKVVPNDMGGNTAGGTASDGSDGRVNFVAVDGYNGHVWTTNTTALKTKVSQWSAPATTTTASGLAAAVNTALSNKCYSVLDLNSSVSSWGQSTLTRMALFGGQEKVCFAITGSSAGYTANLQIDPLSSNTGAHIQLVNTAYDWSNTATFVTTSLPAGAGAVIALGYSCWTRDIATGTTTGFFFAGTAGTATTAPGLYVWATTAGGLGFNPATILGTLNQPPVDSLSGTYSWQRIANISGMPIKIATNGGGLYVLTRSATVDRIYTCVKQISVANLNLNFIVTASSGTAAVAGSTASDLTAAKQIYDFVISVSATPVSATPATQSEQLLALTSDGIYTTTSLAGTQGYSSVGAGSAGSQLSAGWVRLDTPSTAITTLGFFTDYMARPLYDRNPQTFWFANFIANPSLSQSIFNRNIQYQMSRQAVNSNALSSQSVFTKDPSNTATFDGATSFGQTTAPTIYKNFPIIYRMFYDDGCRRFFIVKKTADDTKYNILVLPYNLYDYNITEDGKAAMSDTLVAAAGTFYWMSPIGGDLGQLMMSTDNGLIALQ